VMEATLLPDGRFDPDLDRILCRIVRLAALCRQFAGQFTMLWHNSNLHADWQRRFYHRVVEETVRP